MGPDKCGGHDLDIICLATACICVASAAEPLARFLTKHSLGRVSVRAGVGMRCCFVFQELATWRNLLLSVIMLPIWKCSFALQIPSAPTHPSCLFPGMNQMSFRKRIANGINASAKQKAQIKMALDSVGTGAVGYKTCRIRYLLVPAFLVALISICHLTYTCDRQRRDSNEVVLIFCPPGGPKISTQKGDTRLSGIPFLSRLFGPTEQSRNQDLDMAFLSGSRERFRRSNFRLGLACTV